MGEMRRRPRPPQRLRLPGFQDNIAGGNTSKSAFLCIMEFVVLSEPCVRMLERRLRERQVCAGGLACFPISEAILVCQSHKRAPQYTLQPSCTDSTPTLQSGCGTGAAHVQHADPATDAADMLEVIPNWICACVVTLKHDRAATGSLGKLVRRLQFEN